MAAARALLALPALLLLGLLGLRGVAGAPGSLAVDDPWYLPDGLLIGAGVSAIQTEGAWNVSGKAESAADRLMHSPQLQAAMDFQGVHDTAADSYRRFRDDVAAAKALKLTVYRFSMSWARLFPDGKANPEGVQYYHSLIDEILAAGIKPMVTLYHFDHPQSLQDEFLGWEDRRMADKFAAYADFAFKEYGDKVKMWTTLNEPNQYCMYFNLLFVVSGSVRPDQVDVFRCMHNTVLGHMKAYRIYKERYAEQQKGQVGFTALIVPTTPASTNPEDVFAAQALTEFHSGQILDPVVFGDYSDTYKQLVPSDQLNAFSEDEKAQLRGATDFLGINMYNGVTVRYNASAAPVTMPLFSQLMQHIPFAEVVDSPADIAAFDRIVPEALRDSLVHVWQRYKLPIVVAESGFSGPDDAKRAVFFSAYLRTVVSTMRDLQVDVRAYCAWSLIDAFEWSAGYSRPFGLVHVDYESGSLTRTPKEHTQRFFVEMMETRRVPAPTPSPSPPPSSSPAPSAAVTAAPAASLPTLAVLGLLAGSWHWW